MPPRHTDFHPGTLGRHPSANFDQSPSNSPMMYSYRVPPLDTPSPQSDSSFSPPTPVRCITPPHTGSLLEKHAISSYPAKKTQLPLSVYELPTATYMWARWTPREEAPRSREPVIYVKYRPPQCDVDSSSGYSRATSSSSSQTFSSHPSPVSTPPPSYSARKRCSSVDSDYESATSPSDRFLKHPRLSHNNAPRRVVSARSASPPTLPAPPSYKLRPVDKAEANVSHRFGAESDVEIRPARHPHPGHQSNSSSGGGAILVRSIAPAAVPAFDNAALRAIREDDPRKNEWTKYTHPPPDTSTGTDFECTWEIKERDGTTRRCGYSSKKHLVKRHIESKHLQLRPCVCPVCGKGFAQKSNLDTHLNTHTGHMPHQCIYCDERFKDPARRHRHMIQAHGHQSSRTKRNRMPFPSDGDVASSAETSEPDAET
ncbi:hypothetical protein L226DRAFT_529659 [Lentinus tigrinus ALCF2SS1-7]|uniref:C2H2-type domain-containing protein n=1 Tax=Lentinus tigrinus ALCF2SS1-6 TaxID=1328759 RepID=A0A5C2SWB7_9APHY|nr:hypothetical protein L227DRAFT_590128 [Lentinus tigrinus ALCF2SS1-6]RPD81247.1 hypothetical protein L226DRAFT_529659 [Lentinus tigrinus ALCF2SS1-7]